MGELIILTILLNKNDVSEVGSLCWSCREYGRISAKHGLVAQSNSEGWSVSVPRCGGAGEVLHSLDVTWYVKGAAVATGWQIWGRNDVPDIQR